MEEYHRLSPQIIHLDVECTGDPKVKHCKVLTKVVVDYRKCEHIKFNLIYVCMLKVAKDRHSLIAQSEDAGIADFGFLGSQNSAVTERGDRAGQMVEVEGGRNNLLEEEDN